MVEARSILIKNLDPFGGKEPAASKEARRPA
jgi:hypothetical protein